MFEAQDTPAWETWKSNLPPELVGKNALEKKKKKGRKPLHELQNAIEILFFIYKYVSLLPQDIFQDCSLFNTVLDRSDLRVQFLLHVNQSNFLALGGCICPSNHPGMLNVSKGK